MRYGISFNAVSKVIFGILGTGQSTSWVEVRPDEIHGQMGWTGSIHIPRRDIATVEKVDHVPWWMGVGVHGYPGTWAFNGAITGAVKITTRRPARGKVMVFPIRPKTMYFSLETPDEFVYEVSGKKE